MVYNLGQMPGFSDQLAMLQRGGEAQANNQLRMAQMLAQRPQAKMPEPEEGFMAKLGTGLGAGISSGLTGLVNEYLEKQAEQRSFGRREALRNALSANPDEREYLEVGHRLGTPRADMEAEYGIDQAMRNRLAQQQEAQAKAEYNQAKTEDLRSKTVAREQALQNQQNEANRFAEIQSKNPKATVKDYLAAGVSPDTIKDMALATDRLTPTNIKEREVEAQEGRLSMSKQKAVVDQLKDLELPKNDESEVQAKAFDVLKETGNPMEAIKAAKQEARKIKKQRQQLKDVAKEFDPPNIVQDLGGLRGKREEVKQQLKMMLPKLGIDNKDMIYDELRRVGWKFDEIEEIMGATSSPVENVVTQPPTTNQPIDRETAMKFMEQANGDPTLAQQLATQAGY